MTVGLRRDVSEAGTWSMGCGQPPTDGRLGGGMALRRRRAALRVHGCRRRVVATGGPGAVLCSSASTEDRRAALGVLWETFEVGPALPLGGATRPGHAALYRWGG